MNDSVVAPAKEIQFLGFNLNSETIICSLSLRKIAEIWHRSNCLLLTTPTKLIRLKFTVEEEHNSSIPFLDIKIHRHNNSFEFSVYRKPTNNLFNLHYYSHHASNVKKSAFRSTFLRALRICSPDFIDQDIKFIYSIARDNQYPEHLIDDAYHRAIKSYHNSNVSRDPIQNVQTLPFHRLFLPLVNIFKHFNITIVFPL